MCVSVLIPSCKSFINRTNSKGPKMDPWGTPDRTGAASRKTQRHLILHFVHVRRDSPLKTLAV